MKIRYPVEWDRQLAQFLDSWVNVHGHEPSADVIRDFERRNSFDNPKGVVKRIPVSDTFTIVDADDLPLVAGKRWYLGKGGYACTLDGGTMHRILMRPAQGLVVDHINGNRLDNRRANLRVCTNQQNVMNSRPTGNRKFKGTRLHKGAYVAQITHNRKNHYLGRFPTEEEAARAYDAAARKMFGEFAWLNFPDEQTEAVPVLGYASGERNGQAKLNWSAVLEIRARGYSAWDDVKAMAVEFGVAPTVVYCVLKGDTWKHPPAEEIEAFEERHRIKPRPLVAA